MEGLVYPCVRPGPFVASPRDNVCNGPPRAYCSVHLHTRLYFVYLIGVTIPLCIHLGIVEYPT